MSKTLRVVVLGAEKVGKTSLTIRFVANDFDARGSYHRIWEESYGKNVCLDDVQYRVEVLDTVCRKEHSPHRETWMREAPCFVLVYAIDCVHSFEQIQGLITCIQRAKGNDLDKVYIALVGNKSDSRRREVPKKRGKDLAKSMRENGIQTGFFETSAKNDLKSDAYTVFHECVRQRMRVVSGFALKPLPEYHSCECCLSHGFSHAYDIVTILISIADIATDVWVCFHYHKRGRTAAFGLSLAILCAAQLSYVLAFINKFSQYEELGDFCLMFCLLPISPLLSFIIYFASNPGGFVYEKMDAIGFRMKDPTPRANESKIEQFVKSKLIKHMGFLLKPYACA